MNAPLTERQKRELDYHREHAKLYQAVLARPFSWEVLDDPGRRWWNPYWGMFDQLIKCDLAGKQVLVVGCGFGEDALRLAKLGAVVSAFDLSPDSLQIARALSQREGLDIHFDEMTAEAMHYADATFDCIVARDILHHVDIPRTMQEIARVAKPDALLMVNEIYSHSWTEKVRRSALVEQVLYPRMRRLIYGPGKPYITEDERKLNEDDLQQIGLVLHPRDMTSYFNFLVTRLIPDRYEPVAKLDRLLLKLLRPIGQLLAGRVLFTARIRKPASGL